MIPGKINVVIDGQWGSTGKGKFVGYLARYHDVDVSVCNFMTNAGHTFVEDDGTEYMFQHLPVSAVNSRTKLYLASSCGITLDLLFKEIKMMKDAGMPVEDRLFIDKHAFIIDPIFAQEESVGTVGIASTMKGCGFALAEKIKRTKAVRLAKDVPELKDYIVDVSVELNKHIKCGHTIIGETAQGFDLSLNHGYEYPFVTSRDVTPMQFMNDCGVNTKFLGTVYGILRTYPIRVGNVVKNAEVLGYSGNFYSDQRELDWDKISELSGKTVKELTTVTKRVRRVFNFGFQQYEKFLRICRPNIICLNFVNYFEGIDNNSKFDDLFKNESFKELKTRMEYSEISILGKYIPHRLYGTGAKNSEIIDCYEDTHEMPYFTTR